MVTGVAFATESDAEKAAKDEAIHVKAYLETMMLRSEPNITIIRVWSR